MMDPPASPAPPRAPVRVLHVRSQYVVDGGVETFINALFRFTDDAAVHDHTLLVESRGIERPAFCEDRYHDRPGELLRMRWDKKQMLANLRELARIVDELGIEVIHTHDNRANLLTLPLVKLLRRGVAWLASGHGWIQHPWKSRVIQDVDRALVPLASAVHLASRSLVGEVRPFRPRRLAIVPYFVDRSDWKDAYDTQAVRRAWGVPDDCVLLGMVGRLGEEKGHTHLLQAYAEAAPQMPPTRLALVGDGPIRERLQAEVQELGIADRVILPGQYPDAIEACATFDVLTHSSLGETLSIAILEALFLGKPFVATQVGANADSIAHGENGYLVPPADAGAFARALVDLVSHPERLAAFGAASRERSKRFEAPVIARQYEAVYRALADGEPVPG